MKPITYTQIEKIVRDNYQQEGRLINLHKLIVDVMQKWEGKKINIRIREQIQEALQRRGETKAHVVYTAAGTFNATITIYNITGFDSYNNSVTFDFPPIYSESWFNDHNQSSGAAAETRNAHREKLLKNKQVFTALSLAVNKLNVLREVVSTHMADFEHDSYTIERLAGLRDDRQKLY